MNKCIFEGISLYVEIQYVGVLGMSVKMILYLIPDRLRMTAIETFSNKCFNFEFILNRIPLHKNLKNLQKKLYCLLIYFKLKDACKS